MELLALVKIDEMSTKLQQEVGCRSRYRSHAMGSLLLTGWSVSYNSFAGQLLWCPGVHGAGFGASKELFRRRCCGGEARWVCLTRLPVPACQLRLAAPLQRHLDGLRILWWLACAWTTGVAGVFDHR